VLPDVENIGIAIGISLLSCIKAEMYVISYLLPVMASDSLRGILVVSLDLKNMGIAVGISLLSLIETELPVRLISFFQPPSWISDFPFHPTVILMMPLKSFPPKT